ncbi:MAG: nucleotidyltransferase family protein [Aigarchaeota archaeon]|nr:nucleotidyltransferase family protein [Candidatus Geocrenenecus dongiae]
MEERIALILLAAGKSTRFPGNKLLANVCGMSLIERILRTTLRSSVDVIVVVLGHEAEKLREIIEKIKDNRVKIVYNLDYELGQSSSVKKGLKEVAEFVDAVMILPADVSFIKPEDIDSLIETFKITKKDIVVASHKGKHGHPILFSKKLFKDIMMITEEKRGLKEVVEKNLEEIVEVELSPYTVIDIDTPEDLEKVIGIVKRDALTYCD